MTNKIISNPITRWLAKRDTDAQGSKLAGIVTTAQVSFTALIGILNNSLLDGVITFFLFWCLKAFIGYVDIYILHYTPFSVYYFSVHNPARVIVAGKTEEVKQDEKT